jgi:hypothetical protein
MQQYFLSKEKLLCGLYGSIEAGGEHKLKL